MLSKNEQNALVAEHMNVVRRVIRRYIKTNESIYNLGYDDLFQEGCILLCKAAAAYDPGRAEFEAFAQRVIRNGLISYCRKISSRSKITFLSLNAPLDPAEGGGDFIDALLSEYDFNALDSHIDTLELLKSLKDQYQGTVRQGIEALEWLVQGRTITEIAQMYSVKPNLIGARISRAAACLRQDERFTGRLSDTTVEKQAA